MHILLAFFLAWAAAMAVPFEARAYSVSIHNSIADALGSEARSKDLAKLPATVAQDQFRARFYQTAAQVKDESLRNRFLKRYPNEAAFTAVAFKEFFGMAATAPALGFDAVEAVMASADKKDPHAPLAAGQERSLADWIRIGSLYPDLDHRNRGRWWVVDGVIQTTKTGERIPFDPVVLNMGRVEGLSGQAHAHYGLNRNPKSDDAAVLKERPADFAVAVGFKEAPVLTFGPERAQAYGDLALLARQFGEPALSAVYAGAAMHYIEDLSNQIHTIQVGIYPFFVDATLQAWKMKVKRLWGMLGPVPERNSIGIDIITNHHTWSEEYTRIAVESATAGKPLYPGFDARALFVADPAEMSAWETLPVQGSLLLNLADRIILAGNAEGPEIYGLTRDLTTGNLRSAGVKIDFELEPDSVVVNHLSKRNDKEDLARFFALEKKGIRRASSAMVFAWRKLFSPDAPPADADVITARLLQMQLSEIEAAESRRQVWARAHGGFRNP